MPFTSPHPTPHHSLPAGAPTVPSTRVPPQCCLSLRISLGLKPPHCLAFLDIRTPQASPVMHLYFPVHCGCPAALHVPAEPQGHLSPCTALVTSEPCRCTVASLPAEPPEPWPPMSSFCPKTHPLSSIEQQVLRGQEQLRIHTSPSPFGSFPSSSHRRRCFWCSRSLPQPSHSKPTCQPQPGVVDQVPGHRLEQEDESSLGICWQQPLCPQG